MTAERIAALILEDDAFRAAVIDADPHTLQLEIRELTTMLAAADYRHSPDGAPLPDIDALAAEVVTLVTAQLLN
jgi:hypothetical protein